MPSQRKSLRIRNMRISKSFIVLLALLLVSVGSAALVRAQEPASQERIATFKKTLHQSQVQLRNYEWIETTTVMLKGEVKSQKQNRCYYAADGKIQKVAIGSSPAPAQPSGGRLKRRIVAKKTEEMSQYMKDAVELVHRYVPPSPEMIQFAKDNGKAKFGVMEPNKVIQFNLNDIVKTGDLMSATLDIQANAILEIGVSTYLEDAQDGVKLAVLFKRLPDGTSYSSQTTLDARAKDIKVVVENSGHRKMN